MLCLSPQCHAPSHNVMQCSDWSDGGCRRHEERTDGAQSEEEEDRVEEIRREGQPSPVKTQLSYWQIIYHQSGILYTVNIMEIYIHSSVMNLRKEVKVCREFAARPYTVYGRRQALQCSAVSRASHAPLNYTSVAVAKRSIIECSTKKTNYCESDSK